MLYATEKVTSRKQLRAALKQIQAFATNIELECVSYRVGQSKEDLWRAQIKPRGYYPTKNFRAWSVGANGVYMLLVHHPDIGWVYGGKWFKLMGSSDKEERAYAKNWKLPHSPQGRQIEKFVRENLKAQLMPYEYMRTLYKTGSIVEAILGVEL